MYLFLLNHDICHCQASGVLFLLMKHLGLHLHVLLHQRCCFILLCVPPGRQLKLHLQQPGPSASSGPHISHTQPIRNAADELLSFLASALSVLPRP